MRSHENAHAVNPRQSLIPNPSPGYLTSIEEAVTIAGYCGANWRVEYPWAMRKVVMRYG